MREFILAATALFCVSAAPFSDNPKLSIHEWGTFTCLQDESGHSIRGINAAVEPLPAFVHTAVASREVDTGKGVHVSHPDVTMRLETPVLYFHLPHGTRTMQLDVRESFQGGWLTQYYPDAQMIAPGIDSQDSHITAATVGSVTWKNLKIGASRALVKTDAAVWLAPREVAADDVQTPAGESERFLFDRGVAHIDAPLQIIRNGSNLEFRSQVGQSVPAVHGLMSIPKLWLLDIRGDGSRAFRAVDGFTLTPDPAKLLATIPADFTDADYHTDLKPLLDSMHAELTRAGLNSDEATALLNTWQSAYFKSQGQRLLFLAPRDWTDHYLPLEVSVPCETTRVMVARIELVTPQYRDWAKRWTTHQDYAALDALNHWRFGTPLIQAQWMSLPH